MGNITREEGGKGEVKTIKMYHADGLAVRDECNHNILRTCANTF